MQSLDTGYRKALDAEASDLNGSMLGRIVQFRYEMPEGRVHIVVIGELRKVSHIAHQTVLYLRSHIEDTEGELAVFPLLPASRVSIMERA